MIRKVFLILFILAQAIEVSAYTVTEARAYIARYKDMALQHEREYGIPASITLAQGLLESDAGNSGLTRSSNNHFGIKQGGGWKGKIHRAWDDEVVKSKFRVYASDEESFRDHARLLSNTSRYRPLFSHSVYDYRAWAHGLKKAQYATAPNYAEALIGIIECFKLYNINGGAKMRPGKTVVITRYVEVEYPEDAIEEESEIADEEYISEEEENYLNHTRRFVVSINDLHCTVVQPGEDLYTIARRYDISPKKLLYFNELGRPDQVEEGDIVFLEEKKDRFTGPQDATSVKEGQTLRQISQEFGIKVDRLARLNHISRFQPLEKGTRINIK